ncbi:EF-hand calcium-binding domain-containing protein 6 [Biomphalaria pfeifferi]|uniref:EF-hand calcium-binding domain-containing protein 6 n=1 Tax=Biomphalaria pfeifferi TaxID=112525 RepID=A0AAD8B6P9_BIOPF|nr:EF-hand calcium-binding domain-containing protein 6 [Biomphalaria pfeifferi]
MSQMGSRPASQIKGTVSLPEIKHPFSQLGNLNGMDVRGVSRAGEPRPSSILPNTGRPLANEGNQTVRKSFSAAGRESRYGLKNKENIHSPLPLTIPEGVEVKHGDPNVTRLPVFGNRASVEERDVVSRASTSMSRASGQARLEIDELEASLRERLKNRYYDVKKKFKDNDPEGRGNVSREAFTRILVTVLGRSISGQQCQKLMERLGFAERSIIPFTEFFAYFRDETTSEYPQWMDPINRMNQDRVIMTSAQVHAYLKEKAKQRFLDLADLFPQMNPGGSGKIMKSEFRQMLNRMNFHMDDQEFEKLWLRYDPANEGIVSGPKLLNVLGIEWRKSSADSVNRVSPFLDSTQRKETENSADENIKRSPRKKEIERRQQLNVENWLKNKFREGFFNMREAFEEKDPEKTGVVSFDAFIEVMERFGLKLEKKLLSSFLCRCSIKPLAKGVPYREFLHRFQDRGENGITHVILTDVKHRFNNRPSSPAANSTVSAIETQLTNMFQRDFLALLGTFRKIDRLGLDYISQEEFRAAIESRFNMELTDAQFESFIDRVPLDEDGNVQYPKFMQQFDARGQAPSLFDPRPVIATGSEANSEAEKQEAKNKSEDKSQEVAVSIEEGNDLDKKRSPQKLFKVIKDLLSRRFQDVEQKFYEIDETNTRRLTQGMMHQLLKEFDIRPEITLGEIRDLWKTLITNFDKTLDYLQFVRHFGFSLRSAAFPNAKIQPPRRGDADFMMRSRKLNCAADMLQDSLRSKIDYLWDDLRLEFMNMDPYNTGHVTKEEFREVLTELCVNLSNLELEQIISKFQVKQDGRVYYVELLRPFALRKQVWRHGNNMLSLLQHSQSELPVHDTVDAPQKGLPSITTKLRQKVSGDWKSLRRAFRKMDAAGSGYLSLPEFRSVLKLANVLMDEEDVYQVLNEFDRDLTGQISYEKFLNEASKVDTRHKIKSIA